MKEITKADNHRRVAFNTHDLSRPAYAAYCSSGYVMYQVGDDYYVADNETATTLRLVGDVFDVNDFYEELAEETTEKSMYSIL